MDNKFSLLVTIIFFIVLVSADEGINEEKGNSRKVYVPEHDDECVHKANKRGICLHMGINSETDSLVFDGEEHKYGIPFVKRDGEFKFELDPNQGLDYISHIEVVNMMERDHEGYVTLTKGGIGYKNATFLFESQRGEGYHFSIKIFANSWLTHQQQSQQVNVPKVPHAPDDTPQKEYKTPEIHQNIATKSPFIPIIDSEKHNQQQQQFYAKDTEVPLNKVPTYYSLDDKLRKENKIPETHENTTTVAPHTKTPIHHSLDDKRHKEYEILEAHHNTTTVAPHTKTPIHHSLDNRPHKENKVPEIHQNPTTHSSFIPVIKNEKQKQQQQREFIAPLFS